MLDILFVAYNRLAMTQASFDALIANTNWESVNRLYVHDDGSKDGTLEWLEEACDAAVIEADVHLHRRRLGGPVAATNWYLGQSWEAYTNGNVDRFVKIDNDFVVCPGWLDEILHQTTLHPEVDVFGFEPMQGPATMPPFPDRTVREARFIGGKGLIRHRTFDRCVPRAQGRQGWTQFQEQHPEIRKVWIEPDLPCFGLDQLPFEPWLSLTQEYLQNKWGRPQPWPAYDDDFSAYWSWWRQEP